MKQKQTGEEREHGVMSKREERLVDWYQMVFTIPLALAGPFAMIFFAEGLADKIREAFDVSLMAGLYRGVVLYIIFAMMIGMIVFCAKISVENSKRRWHAWRAAHPKKPKVRPHLQA